VKRPRMLELVTEAIWRSGPGPDALLVVTDEEFHDEFKNGGAGSGFVDHEGYRCFMVQRYGSKVYVSCPKLKLEPEVHAS
jgi:hypothetical protein